MQDALLDAVEDALLDIVVASADLLPVLVVGAPLRYQHRIYNTAVVIHRGQVLGVAPKSYLPTYREFYERRQMAAGDDVRGVIRMGEAEIALRSRPAVLRRRSAGLRSARRDLRGHVRADTAERGGRARRRDGAREPVGQPDHDRPRGGPLPACALGVVALPGGLRVCRGGRRGVDHRPGVGRPDDDLGERRAVGRLRALPQGRAALGRRRRSRAAALGAAAHGHLRRQPGAPRHRHGVVPAHRVRARPARRRHRPAPRGRAVPVRPVGSRTAGTGLLRGLQHPGVGTGAAAARAELSEGGDRCLGRPGLHACVDRRRPRDGPRRPAAQ